MRLTLRISGWITLAMIWATTLLKASYGDDYDWDHAWFGLLTFTALVLAIRWGVQRFKRPPGKP